MSDHKKEPSQKKRLWNSLEISKLFATPLIAAAFGWFIWQSQQAIVQHWEQDQLDRRAHSEAVSKERDQVRGLRLSIYKEAAPLINDILSYNFYVGRWKEYSPADIIEKKRKLDSLMYSNMALLTPEFFKLYYAFMRESFRTAGNAYGESRIRTQAHCRRPQTTEDTEHWLAYFTHEDTRQRLCLAYVNLLQKVSEELLLQSLKMPSQTDPEKPSTCPPMFDSERC